MQVTGDDELAAQSPADWESAGATATQLVSAGKLVEARRILRALDCRAAPSEVASRIANDLGVIAVLAGDTSEAALQFGEAISRRPEWIVPRRNLQRIEPAPQSKPTVGEPPEIPKAKEQSRTRVAIVSLLFNWPSTGGGTVHTAETARFLQRAGYDVRHLSLRFDPWGLGQVREPVDWPLQELAFTEADWRLDAIQQRVRKTLEAFQPDAVIVTDSWSMKPRLAEACRGFRTYLRLAAQECLCPLTNVRLLAVQPEPVSCPRHQLATPDVCRQCVTQRNQNSGTLHQLERQLAGFHTSAYVPALQRAFADAAGILVVNPLIAEMCKPYAQAVHVLPSGFDPDRFPWTSFEDQPARTAEPLTLFFAGLTQEVMKGFHVLREACRRLWSERQDFRLRITADAEPNADAFCEFVGWQSQGDLPRQLRQADIVVCPTIAEEALGRTAVEAMGAWRPVVASRIGGLPFTVLDEATGLLCRPGDPVDLARQLGRLLDDATLREWFGTAGRRRFDEAYAWPVILEQGYRPLLGPRFRAVTADGGGLLLEPMTPRVSLCMIVRNNADTIRPCLESIRPWVDEMSVIDTGSTDATPQICAELGAKVRHGAWRDDFSAARNESLKDAAGEWIFWMDSDDTIPADCGRQLRELVDGEHPPERLGYVLQVHCPGPGDAGRHDVTVVDHVKLFRNWPELRFEHRIHEQILPAIRRAGGEVAFTDIFVVHSGSDHSAAGRVRKLERDFKLLHLDLAERPSHPFVLFNLGMTYADTRQFDEADRWLTRCLAVSQPQESHVRKAYALLLSVLYQQARHAEADTVCTKARQLYPDDKELLFRQAMLQHAQGRLEEAAATYRQVLEAPAERHFASVDAELAGIKARHNLAVVLGDLGAWNAAVGEWNTILTSHPDYGPAQEGLRQALQSQSATVVASRRGAVHRPSQQTVRAGPGS